MSQENIEALCKAAERGQVARIRELLGKGTPVDGKDKIGSTPLMQAAENGQVEAVRVLLEAGADPGIKLAGSTILRMVKDQIAMAAMDVSIARLLPKLKEIETILKQAASAPKVVQHSSSKVSSSKSPPVMANKPPQEDAAMKAKAKALLKAAARGDAEKIRQLLRQC